MEKIYNILLYHIYNKIKIDYTIFICHGKMLFYCIYAYNMIL